MTLKVQKSDKYAPLKASLTRFQMQLPARVKDDPSISYDVLAEKLERNRTTVMRNIQKLKNIGALKRIGAAEFRNTHFSYVLGDEGVEKFVSTPELHSENSIGVTR